MAAILICDDEPPLRELMRAALPGSHLFLEAGDGGDALELVREARPDVVLLDVMLPGMSGLDVLRAIRRDPSIADMRVVLVTAWDSDEDRRAAEELGVDAFVPKPFLPEELAAVVEGLLGEPAA